MNIAAAFGRIQFGGRSEGAQEDGAQPEGGWSLGAREEFLENDPEFEELPHEEQELTVSAYERTVEKGLLVPYEGLLSSVKAANLATGFVSDEKPTLFAAVAGDLPRLDEPQVVSLEWGEHLNGIARAFAWCDAFRSEEFGGREGGKKIDDCQLLRFEPLCVALARTLALRCRGASGVGSAWPSEATHTYADARARFAEAINAETPVRLELENLKSIVSFHEATGEEDLLLAARLQVRCHLVSFPPDYPLPTLVFLLSNTVDGRLFRVLTAEQGIV
jgi:hypothetical protein